MFLRPGILCKWTSIAIELKVGKSDLFSNISEWAIIEILG